MRGPIVVGGMPRSGTTFMLKLLNVHQRIAVTSEINPKAGELACALMRQLTVYMNRHEPRQRLWDANRPDLMVQIWKSVTSPGHYRNKPADARIAHKTPGSERLFEDYVRIFDPNTPQLIYCLRNGAHVMRSLLNVPWKQYPLSQRLEEYKNSVHLYEHLQEAFPQHVIRLQSDSAGSTVEDRLATVQALFEFLGEELDEPSEKFAREWRVTNSMQEISGRAQVADLTDEQLETMVSDDEFLAIQRRYGYDTLSDQGGPKWRRLSHPVFDLTSDAWQLSSGGRALSVASGKNAVTVTVDGDDEGWVRLGAEADELASPPVEAYVWHPDSAHHELYVDLRVLQGEPEAAISILSYDGDRKIDEVTSRLRSGRNVIEFNPPSGTKCARLVLEFGGRGKVEVANSLDACVLDRARIPTYA